ncbi:expressed unknown protein [Seminavis robusta]|uniref:Uncharacterized protein n=1 Tax=Seminavis robusta TaxID=568900 RepID=A0A9N8E2B4_9STRA|nr:expressed unknown protein [Seminavis robusta]|eukprot:Sro435_g142310.1 n/a (178) ;mRNA; r:26102-26635
MPFFRSNKPSTRKQVKIVKAVNGGRKGHHDRRKINASRQQNHSFQRPHLDDFWGAIDEHEFAQQHPSTEPVLRNDGTIMEKVHSFRKNRRQYSTETHRTRQSSTQRDTGIHHVGSSPEQEDFWKMPTGEEKAEIAAGPMMATIVKSSRTTKYGPPPVIIVPEKKKRLAFLKRFIARS